MSIEAWRQIRNLQIWTWKQGIKHLRSIKQVKTVVRFYKVSRQTFGCFHSAVDIIPELCAFMFCTKTAPFQFALAAPQCHKFIIKSVSVGEFLTFMMAKKVNFWRFHQRIIVSSQRLLVFSSLVHRKRFHEAFLLRRPWQKRNLGQFQLAHTSTAVARLGRPAVVACAVSPWFNQTNLKSTFRTSPLVSSQQLLHGYEILFN